MKTRLLLAVLVLQALVFSFVLQPAWAEMLGGCGGGDLDANFEVDKKAPGTKVAVNLTVYYERKDPDPLDPEACALFEVNTDMHYFMRAKIGNDNLTKFATSDAFVTNYNYIFASVLHDVCYLDWDAQKAELMSFIFTTVVPELFADIDLATASVKIKSVDNVVEDQGTRFPGCCEEVDPVTGSGQEIYFLMLDMVLAVQ